MTNTGVETVLKNEKRIIALLSDINHKMDRLERDYLRQFKMIQTNFMKGFKATDKLIDRVLSKVGASWAGGSGGGGGVRRVAGGSAARKVATPRHAAAATVQ